MFPGKEANVLNGVPRATCVLGVMAILEGAEKEIKSLKEYAPKDFAIWLVSPVGALLSKLQVDIFLIFYKMKNRRANDHLWRS